MIYRFVFQCGIYQGSWFIRQRRAKTGITLCFPSSANVTSRTLRVLDLSIARHITVAFDLFNDELDVMRVSTAAGIDELLEAFVFSEGLMRACEP